MHDLTFTEGTKPYIHGQDLPLLTATCSCGEFTRESHRFDAVSNPANRQTIMDDHAVHVARQGRWPAHGSDLHPLLGGYFNGDRTEGEYRKLRVPMEAGGLSEGTTYFKLTTAIHDEIQACVESSKVHTGVSLEVAPRLAAAYALLDQLKKHMPKVEAWRVMVAQPRDRNPSHGGAWCYLACHTQEEAEGFAPVVLEHLNRDRRNPDDPFRYEATVDLGPVELYKLQMPGVNPASKRFG